MRRVRDPFVRAAAGGDGDAVRTARSTTSPRCGIVRSVTAPLSPPQARRFHDRFGIAVLNSYGQTELGGEVVGWSAADSREFGDVKLGAVGRPHAGVEVRVDGERRGGRRPLWVRTPALGGLRRGPTDRFRRLVRTGDIASVDDDGFVWIEGRVSAT